MTQSDQNDIYVTAADLDAAAKFIGATECPEECGTTEAALVNFLTSTNIGPAAGETGPDLLHNRDFRLGVIVGVSYGIIAERVRVGRVTHA
jgi:hypothetical protein